MDDLKLNMLLDRINIAAAIEDRDEDIQSEINNYSGGNLNDAYSLGFEQGMGFLARQLQEVLGEE